MLRRGRARASTGGDAAAAVAEDLLKSAARGGDDDDDDSNKEPCTLIDSDKVSFCGDVTRRTMTQLISTLYATARELPTPRQPGDKPRLYLLLRTNGGSLYDALAAYDHMVKLRERVDLVTVAEGFVASAGTVLLLAGSSRLAMRNAGLLFHQLSSGVSGKYADMRDEVQACSWLMSKLYSIYQRNSRLTRAQVKRLLSRERTLSAKKCIAMGFVDDFW